MSEMPLTMLSFSFLPTGSSALPCCYILHAGLIVLFVVFSGFYCFWRQSVRSTCSKDLQSKCLILKINPELPSVYVAHTEYSGGVMN